MLYEARALAAKLVGADPPATSIVHPIRWPGSWHRKKTPRLAKIVALSEDAEIDLGRGAGAIARGGRDNRAAPANGAGQRHGDQREASDPSAIAAAWR